MSRPYQQLPSFTNGWSLALHRHLETDHGYSENELDDWSHRGEVSESALHNMLHWPNYRQNHTHVLPTERRADNERL